MMISHLDIVDSLAALNYNGKAMKEDCLKVAINKGIQSKEFREIVCWLAKELHILQKTDEAISTELEDLNEFALELSSLLKELGCPYIQFVTGPLSERFDSYESLMNLLDYLISELMATKMALKTNVFEGSYVIPMFTTNTAKALEQLSKDLQIGEPPANVTSKALFDKLKFKVEDIMQKTKKEALSEPLLKSPIFLSEQNWQKLEKIHEDLDIEYNMRRQVLLTRLEVTIQSFQWSESIKNRLNDISIKFKTKMNEMESLRSGGEDTNIVALLAAREDLAIIEKTSSANVRKNTASQIQKHVIGSVPDRGGRAHEHVPPPPEMPSWQQQRSSGPSGVGSSNHGGRGGTVNFRGRGGGNWQHHQYGNIIPQQQRFEQRQHFEQIRDSVYVNESGRVQGTGWTHRNNEINDRNNGRDTLNSRGRRGRSNYNRGGEGSYTRR